MEFMIYQFKKSKKIPIENSRKDETFNKAMQTLEILLAKMGLTDEYNFLCAHYQQKYQTYRTSTLLKMLKKCQLCYELLDDV